MYSKVERNLIKVFGTQLIEPSNSIKVKVFFSLESRDNFCFSEKDGLSISFPVSSDEEQTYFYGRKKSLKPCGVKE